MKDALHHSSKFNVRPRQSFHFSDTKRNEAARPLESDEQTDYWLGELVSSWLSKPGPTQDCSAQFSSEYARYTCCSCDHTGSSEDMAADHTKIHPSGCFLVCRKPLPGDHIYRWDGHAPGRLYAHHGICVPEVTGVGGVRVVHFHHNQSLNVVQHDPEAVVRCDTLVEFLTPSSWGQASSDHDTTSVQAEPIGAAAYLTVGEDAPLGPDPTLHVPYLLPHLRKDCFPRQEVVARALFALGKEGFGAVSSNCEHFAWWCKTGDWHSTQSLSLGGQAMSVSATVHATGFMMGGPIGLFAAHCFMHAAELSAAAYVCSERWEDLGEAVTSQARRAAAAVGFGESNEAKLCGAQVECCVCAKTGLYEDGCIRLNASKCDHLLCDECLKKHLLAWTDRLAILATTSPCFSPHTPSDSCHDGVSDDDAADLPAVHERTKRQGATSRCLHRVKVSRHSSSDMPAFVLPPHKSSGEWEGVTAICAHPNCWTLMDRVQTALAFQVRMEVFERRKSRSSLQAWSSGDEGEDKETT